jgi:hypothetical protein
MMEAVRTSETSVDNHFTRQYNPEDSSEHNGITHIPLKQKSVIRYVNGTYTCWYSHNKSAIYKVSTKSVIGFQTKKIQLVPFQQGNLQNKLK